MGDTAARYEHCPMTVKMNEIKHLTTAICYILFSFLRNTVVLWVYRGIFMNILRTLIMEQYCKNCSKSCLSLLCLLTLCRYVLPAVDHTSREKALPYYKYSGPSTYYISWFRDRQCVLKLLYVETNILWKTKNWFQSPRVPPFAYSSNWVCTLPLYLNPIELRRIAVYLPQSHREWMQLQCTYSTVVHSDGGFKIPFSWTVGVPAIIHWCCCWDSSLTLAQNNQLFFDGGGGLGGLRGKVLWWLGAVILYRYSSQSCAQLILAESRC